jgi:hypothetical protein
MDYDDDYDFDGLDGFGGPDDAPALTHVPVKREGPRPERGAAVPMHAQAPPEYVHTGAQPPVPGGPPEYPTYAAHRPTVDVYAAPQPMPRPGPPPGMDPYGPPPYNSQAVGAIPSPVPTGKGGLAATLLTLGVGAAVGGKMGGVAGAGAGVLLGGAVVNTVRAMRAYLQGTEAGDREGRIAATYATVGFGAGGYLGYKYAYPKWQTRARMSPNATDLDAALSDADQMEAEGLETAVLDPQSFDEFMAAETPAQAKAIARRCDIRKVGP